MSNNERDTKFLGFAKLLQKELDELYMTLYARIYEHRRDEILATENETEKRIAQRAYDLVYHVFDSMNIGYQSEHGDPPDCVKDIPDLTEWPTSET